MKLRSKGFKEIILDIMVLCLRYCKIQIKMENLPRPPVIQLGQSSSAVLNHKLPTSAILHKGGNLNSEYET